MPSQRSRAFARLDSVQGLDKGSPPVSRRQSGRTPAGSRPAVQDPQLLGFGSWPRLKTVCFRSTPLYETEFAGASIVLYQGWGGEGNDDTTRGSSALAWNSGAGSRTGCRCLAGLFRRRPGGARNRGLFCVCRADGVGCGEPARGSPESTLRASITPLVGRRSWRTRMRRPHGCRLHGTRGSNP